MTKEQLLAEIRLAQQASESGAPEQKSDRHPSSAHPEELLAAVADVIHTRLEATQERLISSIKERVAEGESAHIRELLAENSSSQNQDRALVGARSTHDGESEPPISAGAPIATQIPHQKRDLTEILDRLDAIEQRLHILSQATPAATLPEVLKSLKQLSEKLEIPPATAEPLGALLHSSLEPLDARLTEIERKLAHALEDRCNTAASENASGALAGDPAQLSSLSAHLPQIETKLADLWEAISSKSSGKSAQNEISTLRRDFSLLVRTLNEHLEESRQLSDRLESSIDQMKQSILALAKDAHLDLPDLKPPMSDDSTPSSS